MGVKYLFRFYMKWMKTLSENLMKFLAFFKLMGLGWRRS